MIQTGCFNSSETLPAMQPAASALTSPQHGINGPQHFVIKTKSLFPTCQVRVVRFYQNCSPLPRLAVLLLLLLFLASSSSSASSSSFSSTMSASTSTSTSALPTLRQALCQLPSSMCTAGPQRPDRMPEDMPDRKL